MDIRLDYQSLFGELDFFCIKMCLEKKMSNHFFINIQNYEDVEPGK